jgi:NitT/TauT family transport system permease protein
LKNVDNLAVKPALNPAVTLNGSESSPVKEKSASGGLLLQAGTILFTVAGFIAAVLVNLFVPQYASGVKIASHEIGSLTVDMNGAYRFVLIVIAAIYAVSGIIASRNKDTIKKYANRAAFRFAMGLALALWDILGTKTQVLPQPFFPGPAGIVEAFLVEGGYILQNTLYSLRLFAVGFIIGVIFGVTTGHIRLWLLPFRRLW